MGEQPKREPKPEPKTGAQANRNPNRNEAKQKEPNRNPTQPGRGQKRKTRGMQQRKRRSKGLRERQGGVGTHQKEGESEGQVAGTIGRAAKNPITAELHNCQKGEGRGLPEGKRKRGTADTDEQQGRVGK